MSFLNATLILGTLAAVVPVVLHLIARKEPKKVTFPSITFLTKRFESNRSRLRVRRWWLLAMRIAAIAALALAMARPAIHQSLSVTWISIALIAAAGIALLVMATIAIVHDQSRAVRYGLAGAAAVLMLGSMLWGAVAFASGPSVAIDDAGPIAIAMVVDNSLSSQWKTTTDDRTQRMIEVASGVISKLPRTSRIAVLDRSATPASFSLDVAGALSKLESIEPMSQPRSIASQIDAATRLVRTSELENRHVLVLTDFASSTWDDPGLETVLAQIADATTPVSLTVFDTGLFQGTNRSLTKMRLADSTPPAKTPMSISVVLGSHVYGKETSDGSDSVTVEAQMYQSESGLPVVRDGKVVYPPLVSVDRTTAEIADGGASELLLTIPGLPVGTHHGRLRIVGEDAIAADDQRFFSVAVLPPSSVLIVSGDGDAWKEAKVIEDAITATPAVGADVNAEFVAEQIGYADLPVARLSDYAAVVLLDPPSAALSDPSIETYLDGGGGVLATIGPATEKSSPEKSLTEQTGDDSTWLPPLIRRWRVPDDDAFFQVTDKMHPATESLGGDTPWNDFSVSQYWQLKPTAKDSVLIRYAGTGHPAMLAREKVNAQSGAVGRTLVVTTPLPALAKKTRSWNRLFGVDPWPAWLLTRQSIDYLTGRRAEEMMTYVGTPWTLLLGKRDAQSNGGESLNSESPQSLESSQNRKSSQYRKPSPNRGTRLQLFPPDGSPPIPVQVEGEATLGGQDGLGAQAKSWATISDTRSPGIYWIKGDLPGTGFTANLRDDSIELERIAVKQDVPDQNDSNVLDQTLGADGWVWATEPDQISLTDLRSSKRISLTSPAMLLALLVFLLEQVLGNRFYRAK